MYKHPFLPGSNSTIRSVRSLSIKMLLKRNLQKKSYFGDPLANGCDEEEGRSFFYRKLSSGFFFLEFQNNPIKCSSLISFDASAWWDAVRWVSVNLIGVHSWLDLWQLQLPLHPRKHVVWSVGRHYSDISWDVLLNKHVTSLQLQTFYLMIAFSWRWCSDQKPKKTRKVFRQTQHLWISEHGTVHRHFYYVLDWLQPEISCRLWPQS